MGFKSRVLSWLSTGSAAVLARAAPIQNSPPRAPERWGDCAAAWSRTKGVGVRDRAVFFALRLWP